MGTKYLCKKCHAEIDVTALVYRLECELNHLRLLEEAYELSGFGISHCIGCGRNVVCATGLTPLCEECDNAQHGHYFQHDKG